MSFEIKYENVKFEILLIYGEQASKDELANLMDEYEPTEFSTNIIEFISQHDTVSDLILDGQPYTSKTEKYEAHAQFEVNIDIDEIRFTENISLQEFAKKIIGDIVEQRDYMKANINVHD